MVVKEELPLTTVKDVRGFFFVPLQLGFLRRLMDVEGILRALKHRPETSAEARTKTGETMDKQRELVGLVAALSAAKQAEKESNRLRIQAEQQLVAFCDFRKPAGSETYGVQGECRVKLTQPINTSVDSAMLAKSIRAIADAAERKMARGAFRTKYEVAAKEAKTLQDDCPKIWAAISAAVTRKPGKISVEIVELQNIKETDQ